MSLGELRHTKASLRLPLNLISSPIDTNIKIANTQNQQNTHSNAILSEDTATITTLPAINNDIASTIKNNGQQDTSSETILASDSTDSVIPTSCTGSMDSINSFDGGKHSQSNLDGSTNDDASPINGSSSDANEGKTILDNDDEEDTDNLRKRHQLPPYNVTSDIKKCDSRSTANRQSDSTDEDSGIESIVRIAKEI